MINVSFSLVISLLWVHLPELKEAGRSWLSIFLVFAERITLRNSALQKDLLLSNRLPLGMITLPPATEQHVLPRRAGPTG